MKHYSEEYQIEYNKGWARYKALNDLKFDSYPKWIVAKSISFFLFLICLPITVYLIFSILYFSTLIIFGAIFNIFLEVGN